MNTLGAELTTQTQVRKAQVQRLSADVDITAEDPDYTIILSTDLLSGHTYKIQYFVMQTASPNSYLTNSGIYMLTTGDIYTAQDSYLSDFSTQTVTPAASWYPVFDGVYPSHGDPAFNASALGTGTIFYSNVGMIQCYRDLSLKVAFQLSFYDSLPLTILKNSCSIIEDIT